MKGYAFCLLSTMYQVGEVRFLFEKGENMKKLFNHELYNKFYPINSEEEKKKMLDNERFEIIEELRRVHFENKGHLFGLHMAYLNKMKEPISAFGNIKPGAIRYNKKVEIEMKTDQNFYVLEDWVNNSGELLDNITSNNDISIDVLNQALTLINNKKRIERKNILRMVILVLCLVIILIFIKEKCI